MTDSSSSPRWWDFDEFSSAKPSDAQRVTRDVHPSDPMSVSAVAPVASQHEPDFSDATPTDEFLASLPDDMAEAELEVAGYVTTPPTGDQAVPPPPAATAGGDWNLPSMPGFAADLPTPPAPTATGAGLVDLPDTAAWAAEVEALAQDAAEDDSVADLADWDIPAVPGLQEEVEPAPEAEDFGTAFTMPEDTGEEATVFEDNDEDVEYIPGVWSDDGGSWSQEGQEDRWTGADGAGSVVTTDMPDWMYEGPSTADEGWDEYEAYEAAASEYEAATGESVAQGDDEVEDYWAEQTAEPVAVTPAAPDAPAADTPAEGWGADQSWDAVADDDATSWDLPTADDATAWDTQADDTATTWDTPTDDTATTWDFPSTDTPAEDSPVEGAPVTWESTGEEDTQQWDVPTADEPVAWMAAGEEDQSDAPSADGAPITWEDINTWADESDQANLDEGEGLTDAGGGMDWSTTTQTPDAWQTEESSTWGETPDEDAQDTSDWFTPSVEAQAHESDAEVLPSWDMPDVGGPDVASIGDSLSHQPDAFGGLADPLAETESTIQGEDTAVGGDWQVTETESSWASTQQGVTPAWGAPEEDTTTSWTTGEADVTPSWGAESAAELTSEPQWGGPIAEDLPAPPPPGAMSFAAQSDDLLADPLSDDGDTTGFPTTSEQLPPPPPVGGSVPMAPEDLPEWMRPDEPGAEEVGAPLTPVSEEEAVVEEIAAPFNPVIAGVEEAPAGAPVRDPGLITAPIPEDQLPPPPNEAAPVRPTWGQPGPSGIGPAPITSPTLSHPVPEGSDTNFSMPPSGKASKVSSLKRILLAVLAALLLVGGAYAAWEFYVRDHFFSNSGGVTAMVPGNSTVTFPADADNQAQWTIDVPKGEAFALTMETPAGIQVGFVAQNAEGQTIGAANTLEDGKNGYRFVAQNDVEGPITLTAKASDSVSADVNMRIVPFAGTTDTVDGVQWNVTVPADQSAIINVLTRGTNPNVVITTADGTEIGSSESFQSADDEDMYNAQFKVPAQAAEQAIVITLKTDQAYDATSTLIVDLHK